MPDTNLLNFSIPTYSLAERDRRWTLARAFMDHEGLDALIVFGEHEDAGPSPFCVDTWFTNDRAGMTVVFPRSEEPIALVPISTYINDHLMSSRRGDASWITAERIRVGRHSGELVDTLNEHGLARGTIGVVGLEPYIPWHPDGIVPYRLWSTILERFPNVEFKPVGLDLTRLMMTLSQEEVAVVRHSASIGDAMARAMVDAARPGVSEAEVFKAGMAAAHERGTAVPAMHLCSGSEPSGSGPPPWTYRPQAPRTLQDGDLILTEVFSNFGMRQTQHQVAIAIGEVHKEFERCARIARTCYDAGLETLRAGAKFGDVAEAMLKPLEEAGGWVRGPQIHGLNPFGSMCRFSGNYGQIPGADRYPHVTGRPIELAEMELEPGMTFAFEPGCGLGSRIITIGGTVVVGEDGPIELNAYTAHLLRAGT